MIDIHCHILAEVDDGPKSWDISEEMCRMAAADGIEHIVATPHANHRYAYDRELLSGVLDGLRQRVGDVPRFSLGCDFHLSYENLQDVMVRPQHYVIGRSRYLLVELSNYSIPVQIAETFQKLMGIGLTPIITHPERNPILQRGPQQILQWVEMGCAVQITASALTGAWGEMAWQIAQWLLKRDAAHFLATDAHDTKRRPPVLSEGRDEVAELCGDDVARALVDGNPRAVVCGQALPYFPQPVMKR
ncbi:MAG TPA: CpsB/CapC family capsule biosynthesis tyrosine phosphatase [Terriglobales bacterium]|nr:CpsB/CapC family capsule biosynthesis tyrosine phosphatase [Terriglobales bacterium]